MRLLITGVTGFAGRHLAELCADEGATVVGLARTPVQEASPPGALSDYLAADLTDDGATQDAVAAARPDAVLNLAGESSVAASWNAPARTVEESVSAAANLLEAVRERAPRAHVLLTGSGEQYGSVAADRLPIREDEPLRPRSPYALAKTLVEELATFYAEVHGLELSLIRAFNHTGPGQSPRFVVSKLAREIAAAELARADAGRITIPTGNLAVRRDFTDVRDVVRAYWTCVEQRRTGVFNVCAGRSVRLSDILDELSRHTSLAVEARVDPGLLRSHDVEDARGSHDKLTEATGWQPAIPLERTLQDTLAWWRAEIGSKVAQ